MSEATATVELVSYIRGDFYLGLQAEYDRAWQERQVISKSPTAGDYWQQRRGFTVDNSKPLDVRQLDFELSLMDMKTLERYRFPLKDCKIGKDVRVPRSVYSCNVIQTDGTAVSVWPQDFYVHLDNSPVDLTRAERLSDAELYALLEPPKPAEPEIVPVVFKRTPRERGDSASRLPLIIGKKGDYVTLPNRWLWTAFHLPHPQFIGRVEASVEVADPRTPPTLHIALYDANGECVLATDLSGPNGKYSADFDQLQLPAGDYLLAVFGPSVRAMGSYTNGCVGVFADFAPSRPSLDELVKQHAGREPVQLGMPSFTFRAD